MKNRGVRFVPQLFLGKRLANDIQRASAGAAIREH
jgi:hypothetical protein